MGEYWKPVNVDKREQVHPHRVGDGLKWREWVSDCDGSPEVEPYDGTGVYYSNTRRRVQELIESGAWSADDEIRIVSDYGGEVHWLGPSTERQVPYGDPSSGDVPYDFPWKDVSEASQ